MLSHDPRKLTLSALLAGGLLLAVAVAAEETDWNTPNKKWVKGPVSYLLANAEQKAFKKLKNDEDRAAFAESFWDKRDPTPRTSENEFRDRFFARVAGADEVIRKLGVSRASLTAHGSIRAIMISR